MCLLLALFFVIIQNMFQNKQFLEMFFLFFFSEYASDPLILRRVLFRKDIFRILKIGISACH